eukprot:11447273-Alexandrium_andersonii.AAC.1
MRLLHPTRNSSGDAPEAMKALYAMWCELHLRRSRAGEGGEMPPPAVTPPHPASAGGARASSDALGTAS